MYCKWLPIVAGQSVSCRKVCGKGPGETEATLDEHCGDLDKKLFSILCLVSLSKFAEYLLCLIPLL